MDVRIGLIQIVRSALVSDGGVSVALSRLDKIGTEALTKGSNVEADLNFAKPPCTALKATFESLSRSQSPAGSNLMTAVALPGQRGRRVPLAAPGFRPPASNAHN
jgi:hypothetical protein